MFTLDNTVVEGTMLKILVIKILLSAIAVLLEIDITHVLVVPLVEAEMQLDPIWMLITVLS